MDETKDINTENDNAHEALTRLVDRQTGTRVGYHQHWEAPEREVRRDRCPRVAVAVQKGGGVDIPHLPTSLHDNQRRRARCAV